MTEFEKFKKLMLEKGFKTDKQLREVYNLGKFILESSKKVSQADLWEMLNDETRDGVDLIMYAKEL